MPHIKQVFFRSISSRLTLQYAKCSIITFWPRVRKDARVRKGATKSKSLPHCTFILAGQKNKETNLSALTSSLVRIRYGLNTALFCTCFFLKRHCMQPVRPVVTFYGSAKPTVPVPRRGARITPTGFALASSQKPSSRKPAVWRFVDVNWRDAFSIHIYKSGA